MQTLKISTWNMDWLLAPQTQNAPQLPPDIPHRTAPDFAALATYAQRLHPDLIGLQEVGDTTTLARLFNAQDYQLFLSGDDIAQHTALAVRQGLRIRRNPDVAALALSPGSNTASLTQWVGCDHPYGGSGLTDSGCSFQNWLLG
ncbi:exonuclease/endonuclease/phosphatase family protein [Acetobacter lambici]|uniref:Endonuclease/exonuclease/phosphatase domain-containing protein n=1 Tax=Acetobacter lambici TaxID=1332824 RepID=A0ABT1EYP3_9PROT|nr:hypothetical protein [Acetobacter lambici]MCP1242055.1 hypothetical protein [Acetobacter lambici]MCP1258071.1 hypothetical protein [Acetobacter lambici]